VRTWRLITDSDAEAARGLAVDEALMSGYARNVEPTAEATLRLYTYAPHCVLVGRYQHLEAEVDREACVRLGVELGRRPTGGGAIIMGPDQLGVAIATRAPSTIGPRDLLRQYAGGIVTGLAELGIHARFRGKNDLEVGGRKIAGLGLYVDDAGALLFHASILADLDIGLMLEVLRIPGAKLADKGIDRVEERITTVSRQLGCRRCGADLRAAIADGFAQTLGVSLARSRLVAGELAQTERRLRDRYRSLRWLEGRAEGAGTRGTAALKTPLGLLRVYAGVQDGALSAVMLTGDFSIMPPTLLSLEAALRWCRADPGRIAEVVHRELSPQELEIHPDAVAAAIWSAAERALGRGAGAAPVRASGSCYFPEAAPARDRPISEEVSA
jgi:lipoate-protein ligase A